jgi:hypothetical protein
VPQANLGWEIQGQISPQFFFRRLPTLPRINAMTGAGSIFALFGNYYDHREWTDDPQADALAICFDWVMTGNDIWAAIEQFQKETDAKQLQFSFDTDKPK